MKTITVLGATGSIGDSTLDERPGWRPEQAVTMEEALLATCVAPAWLEHAEDRRGRLRPGMLADLVVAAVNKVLDEAGDKGKDHLKSRTQGLLPNIPGLDLSGFGL